MIVDSIDTLWLMGLKEEYQYARSWIQNSLTIDNLKDKKGSFFEVNIRVLGGLLGIYHLTKDDLFKEKADLLGGIMKHCFK